jgi:DNA-binding transcriptional MerR regulator
MSYTVGEIARYAGLTVRTLHHYDEIRLLSPSERSAAGYRLYDDADVDRLQQILFYRELDFSLEDIAVILDDRTADPAHYLEQQRQLLKERIARLGAMVAVIERTKEAHRMGYRLSLQEKLMRSGKVRDMYSTSGGILMVASDRISAYDVVLPTPIPDKGAVLTALSAFWFEETRDIVQNT